MRSHHLADGHVRTRASQLEQLALDPTISPPRVFAGQPQDQVDDLWIHRRPHSAWTLAKGSPLAAHELAMPPQDRLWTGQKARPAPFGEPFDDRRQDHPIAGTPPRSATLPLQHPQLMPQGQNFTLELGLLPIANTQQVDQ